MEKLAQREIGGTSVGQLALPLACAGLIGLAAQVRVLLPWTPVPMTLQTLVLCVCAGIMGRRAGLQMMAWYLGLGLAGLPMFAQGVGGFAVLHGPTVGYLVGFGLTAGIIGGGRGEPLRTLVARLILAHAVIYLCGAIWLAGFVPCSATTAVQLGVLPFLGGDLGKLLVAAAIIKSWNRKKMLHGA